jgi:hypothetical protein
MLNLGLKLSKLKSTSVILLCFVTYSFTSAQDYGPTDLFNLSEPLVSPTPASSGRVQQWSLFGLDDVAKKDREPRYSTARAVATSVAFEARESRTSGGFDIDQSRFEARLDFTRGTIKDGLHVFRLSPSLAFTDSSGSDAKATTRNIKGISPGITLGVSPRWWNHKTEAHRDKSISVIVLYTDQEATDTPIFGSHMETDSRIIILNPAFAISSKFGNKDRSKAPHDYRLSVGYTYRHTHSDSNGLSTSSNLGSATLAGRMRFALDENRLWQVYSSVAYDLSLHEKLPAGKASARDATVALSMAFTRNFGKHSNATAEYRHTFDDKYNSTNRYTVAYNVVF